MRVFFDRSFIPRNRHAAARGGSERTSRAQGAGLWRARAAKHNSSPPPKKNRSAQSLRHALCAWVGGAEARHAPRALFLAARGGGLGLDGQHHHEGEGEQPNPPERACKSVRTRRIDR